jgi:hypothetical protein
MRQYRRETVESATIHAGWHPVEDLRLAGEPGAVRRCGKANEGALP